MIVEFGKSFHKSILKIKDKSILKKVKHTILNLEEATNLNSIKGIKKLTGHSSYYRIRVGDFRLGFELINDKKVQLITFTHRKDIYRTFP